jgi:hypothetical protein
VVPLSQTVNLSTNGTTAPSTIEAALDKVVQIVQQQQRDLDRSIKVPDTDDPADEDVRLPSAADRANTIAAYDEDGAPTTAVLSSTGASTTAQYVTLATDSSLTNERVLTGTANQITITDNGPGGTVVISLPTSVTLTTLATTTSTDQTLCIGQVAPSQITSNQNDYAGATKSVALLNTDAARTVTGISAVASKRLIITNNGSFTITLANQSGSSTAANRFKFSTGADILLAANSSIEVYYDNTASRWRDVASVLTDTIGTVYGSKLIYSQTSTVTVANTTSQTTLLTTPAIGSATLPASYLTAGKMIRMSANGTFGITGTPTLALAVGFGGAVNGATITTAAASAWRFEAVARCVATGGGGSVNVITTFTGATNFGASPFTSAVSQTVSVDTTATLALGLFATWGTASASNTISCLGVSIEVLG